MNKKAPTDECTEKMKKALTQTPISSFVLMDFSPISRTLSITLSVQNFLRPAIIYLLMIFLIGKIFHRRLIGPFIKEKR